MADAVLYTVGGTVQASGGVYLRRRADDELLGLCRDGIHAHVLTSRQMGKSSLMESTAEVLTVDGTRCVILDLSQLGTRLSAEEWYLGILTTVEEELELSTDAIGWWRERAHLGPGQRLTQFFKKVVIQEIGERVVVFVDEIDTTLSLDFADDFFAAVRHLNNARSQVPELARLSFVLIGVATPSELIKDPERTPFNIGERVELTDFTRQEALPLAPGLSPQSEEGQKTLGWVLEWTGGHPYLTQRLCRTLADANHEAWSRSQVDEWVASTFLGERGEQDHNLQFVRAMLLRQAGDPVKVLHAYREVRRGRRPVHDDPRSPTLSHLKLSGLVLRKQGRLEVRNTIYRGVFDLPWVRANWPVPWVRRLLKPVVVLSAALIALILSLFALASQIEPMIEQRDLAIQEKAEAEKGLRRTESELIQLKRNLIALQVQTRAMTEQRDLAAQERRQAEKNLQELQAELPKVRGKQRKLSARVMAYDARLQKTQEYRERSELELESIRRVLNVRSQKIRSALQLIIENNNSIDAATKRLWLVRLPTMDSIQVLDVFDKIMDLPVRPQANIQGLNDTFPFLKSRDKIDEVLEELSIKQRGPKAELEIEILLERAADLNVWILDISSGKTHQVTQGGGCTGAVLSADHQRISFIRNSQLWVAKTNGQGEKLIDDSGEYLSILGWNSMTEDYLVISKSIKLYRIIRIYEDFEVFPFSETFLKEFSLGAFIRLSATSAGGRLVYGLPGDPGNWQVLEDSQEYDEPHEVAKLPGSFLAPRWSHDEKTIIFVSDQVSNLQGGVNER